MIAKRYRKTAIFLLIAGVVLSLYLVSVYEAEPAVWTTEVPNFGLLISSIYANYSDGTSEPLYKNQVNQYEKTSYGLVFKKSQTGAIVTSITFTISGVSTASGYTGCQVDLSGLTIRLTVVKQSTGATMYTNSWLQSGTPTITVNSGSQTITSKVISSTELTTIDATFGTSSGNAIFTFSCTGTLRYRGTGGQTGAWISISLPPNAVVTLYRQYF